jgi:hypothetical protein
MCGFIELSYKMGDQTLPIFETLKNYHLGIGVIGDNFSSHLL